VFLFLHSDTVLEGNWIEAIGSAVKRSDFVLGAFRLRLDAARWRYRILEFFVGWRCRCFNLPYGDQSLFTSRKNYEAWGGFLPIPLMEDVELVWKARCKGRLTFLPLHSITSAAKWERDGFWRRTIKNWTFYLTYKKQHRNAWELARTYDEEN
jgi:GT2 family glycosyltransferase